MDHTFDASDNFAADSCWSASDSSSSDSSDEARANCIASARGGLDETIQVEPGGTLFVQLDRGSVEIESHDLPEIRVVARATGLNIERADFNIARAGRDVHVDMMLDGIAAVLVPPFVRLRARVPLDWAVDVKTRGGGVEIRDIGGDCSVESSGSRVEVSGAEGDVSLRTSGGVVDVEDVGGDLQAYTSGGNVRVRRIDGDCDLKTSGGSVRAEDVLGRVDAKSSGGKLSAQFSHSPSGRLETSGGSIEIEYPRGHGVALRAKTSGGSLRIAPDIMTEGRVDKHKANADLDGGGLDLELRTSGGSIRIDTWPGGEADPD